MIEMEEFEIDFEVEWTEYADELDLGVKEKKRSQGHSLGYLPELPVDGWSDLLRLRTTGHWSKMCRSQLCFRQ